MTVKSGVSRVGRLYAIWPLPRGGRGGNVLPYDKKKMEFLLQAKLDVFHVLIVFLTWSALRSGFTSLLFATKIEKKYFFPKHESKATSISEFETKWAHFNHGLNKVANRFGILKFLLAYNNNKIISENVVKSYFQLNFVPWTLALCSLLEANRCLKMRAPLNVKDGGRLVVVVCNM